MLDLCPPGRADDRHRAHDARRDRRGDGRGAPRRGSTSPGSPRATCRCSPRSPSRCGGSTRAGVPYDLCPGVPAYAAAAAALGRELTVPTVAQTVTLTRISALATPMPDGEGLAELGRSGGTLVLHLSVHRIDEVVAQLEGRLRARLPGRGRRPRHPPARDRAARAARRDPRRGPRGRDPDGRGRDRRAGARRRALPGQPPVLGRAMPELSGLPGPVLILGGTAEARALAAALVGAGVPVVSSLAGRVRDPALPAGRGPDRRVRRRRRARGLAARARRRRGRRRHAPLRVDDDRARRRRVRRRPACRSSCSAAPGGRREPGWVWADSLPTPPPRAAGAGRARLPHHRPHEPRDVRRAGPGVPGPVRRPAVRAAAAPGARCC